MERLLELVILDCIDAYNRTYYGAEPYLWFLRYKDKAYWTGVDKVTSKAIAYDLMIGYAKIEKLIEEKILTEKTTLL